MNAPFSPWQQRAYDHAVTALEAGRLGHGLLICGPAGLGKRAVAEHLAQYVLCTDKTGHEPCGKCRGCLLYLSRSQRENLELRPDKSLSHPDGHPAHPDVVFVGHAWRMTPSPPRQLTQIVVDQMRVLSERLSKTPQYGEALIALIDPAEALNENASNALLKTLEEPVPGRYLWLLSAQPATLSATIRSRCQRLEFKLPPHAEALAWLRIQGHPEKEASDALEAARGHPGLADEWLHGGGLVLRKSVASDLEKLERGEIAVIETAQRWTSDEHAELRLSHAADLVLAQAGNAGLTDAVRLNKLATWFDAANRTRDLLRTTVRGDLAMVDLLLAWRGNDRAKAAKGERE
ncbi:MAG TPA: DNA polymerase III subunit delta' [Pseudoxanthomonas sp.]|nr:DNA polymerase III subunit delta' [Pseudoxanthomonas sp.]